MSERTAGDELTLVGELDRSSAGRESLDATLAGDSEGDADTLPPRRADEPPPRLGHYVLLARLGQGGMGAVHAAYDTKLDRKVAIKILHAHGGEAAQVRLVREAQALARLSHPNVVQIYEIATHEGHAFLVMEFVDGTTLREWLAAAPRSRSAILAVFDAAGRGLAAAHRQGLVHRDFKPDNVMIRHDGRVLVMDFGLARGEASVEPAPRIEATRHAALRSNQLSTDLTRTGALLGTPAYMAPEQFRGGELGAHSDQFAFCVALWEALGGRRPFAGSTLGALMVAITEGRVTEPTTSMPSWLRRVLMRGLATDPQQRWPSLDVLLDVLQRDPTRRRRGLGLAVVVVGLLGAAALGWTMQRQHARERVLADCEAEAAQLSAELGPDTRAALEQAFRTAAPALADAALDHALEHMDAYAAAWADMRRQTCIELELERTLAPADAAPMLECLDERRDAFMALLAAWRTPTHRAVAGAAPRAASLELLTTCRDPVLLARRIAPPDDPATREAIIQLRARRRTIEALEINGQHEAAGVEARVLLREAEALGWLPMIVQAREEVGSIEDALGHYELAADILRQAYLEAGRAGDDLLAIRLAVRLGRLIGYDLGRAREGLIWLGFAEMMIARAGLEGTWVDDSRLGALGVVQDELGEFEQALATYERKREIDLALYGPRSVALSNTLNDRGSALNALGRYGEARVEFEHSLAIRRELVGPNHTLVAAAIDNIGVAHYGEGETEKALAAFREALVIWEAVLGPQHPDVAESYANIGLLEWVLGHNDAALAASTKALQIREATLGPEHPELAVSLANLASVQSTMGRFDEALVNHRRGLALREQALGPDHPRFADALAQLGASQIEMEAFADAIVTFERVLTIREAALGLEHPDLASSRVALASALLAVGRAEAALAQLELAAPHLGGRGGAMVEVWRGEALRELGRMDAARTAYELALADLADAPTVEPEARARFGLARVELAAGDRARALEQAREAAALLDGQQFPRAETLRRAVAAFLVEHE